MVTLELSDSGCVIIQRSAFGLRLTVSKTEMEGKKEVKKQAEVILASEEFASLMAGGKELLKGKAPETEDPNQGALFGKDKKPQEGEDD